MNPRTPSEMARLIDHTLLRAGASRADVLTLCEEGRRHGFRAVCVPPVWVAAAAAAVEGTETRACTVVGFPLGASPLEVKTLEAKAALAAGAEELDMVIDLGALRSGDLETVRKEIGRISRAAHGGGGLLKVIIETGVLDAAQKDAACRIAVEEGADFVKTSTGFGPGGATVEDVRFIAERVAPGVGVKASGGIRTLEAALSLIEAGATRIGTSAGAAILEAMGP